MKRRAIALLSVAVMAIACSLISPASDSSQGGEILLSGSDGSVELEDASGESVELVITDSSGSPIADAGVASVASDEGILILVVPDYDSGYLPMYYFAERSIAQSDSGRLAAPLRQGPITMSLHHESEVDEPMMMEVPRGPLQDLWDSEGWERTAESVHEFCESVSILSHLYHVMVITFEATTAYIWGISLNALAVKLAPIVPAAMLTEGAVQLCLAATGEPLGLVDLTGVVNYDLGYEGIFLEGEMPNVVGGRVIDADSGEGLPGVDVSTGFSNVQTLDDGSFYMPASDMAWIDLTVEADGFEPITYQEFLDSFYANLGDIGLVRIGSVTGDVGQPMIANSMKLGVGGSNRYNLSTGASISSWENIKADVPEGYEAAYPAPNIRWTVDWGDGAVVDSGWVTSGQYSTPDHQWANQSGEETVTLTLTDRLGRTDVHQLTWHH